MPAPIRHTNLMSKVEEIEAEIEKLRPEELRQLRDWMDDLLEDQLEFTDAFEAKIQQAERDLALGKPGRTRQTPTAP